MTTDLAHLREPQAMQTPLQDLLRDVPLDHRIEIEHGPTHHQFVPIGRMCHEAAALLDELESLRAEVTRLNGVMHPRFQYIQDTEAENERLRDRIGCGCGGDYGLCSACRAALNPPGEKPDAPVV